MYTDGISESRTKSRMYDVDGIQSTLEQCTGFTEEKMLDILYKTAFEISENKIEDDAVVIIIGRKRIL